MTDYLSEDFEALFAVVESQLENDFTDFSGFEDDWDIRFSAHNSYAGSWIYDEMVNSSVASSLYLPDVLSSTDAVVNDIALGLGGPMAHDFAAYLSTKNLATIIDDFGAAAVGSATSLTAQAQSALDDYARFATKYAALIGVTVVGTKAAIEGLEYGDWEQAAKDVAGFAIAHNAMNLGTKMMAGYAAAIADGFIGPASGNAVAFYGSKVVQAGGGMLLAGAAVYAFNNAWELAKELHSGTIVSDYAWFLGKVNEYAEDFIDDAFDGNVSPGDIGGALTPFMDMWGDAVPVPQLPDWVGDALSPFEDAKTTGSPLAVDLDSDGIELTAFNASTTRTFFDIDGDGFAEQTAWVAADDGLLVRDVNQNGTIDDVTELFGSPTIDGFALLAELDSNGDLFIDASDEDWGDLRIWQDLNGDAITQDGELLTLASLDIVSISLLDVAASSSTINGNPISHASTFKYSDGSTDAIVDAWFVHDNINTKYILDYALDADVIFLPTLRGFGNLSDLHVAMSQNDDLLDLVEDFVVGWGFDLFADDSALNGAIEDILYEWAGVAGVSPTSRGAYIDAQHLEFLEELFAKEFYQWGTHSDPFPIAAGLLEEAWKGVFKNFKAQLLIQIGADSLFSNSITYNASTGELDGAFVLSQAALDDLVDYATDVGVTPLLYWVHVASFFDATIGLDNVTATEEGWLDTALYDSGLSETWDEVAELFLQSDTSGGTQTGDSSDETIIGTALDDTLVGGGGTDTIYGDDGDDWMRSHTAADSAGDTLYGDDGNDLIEGNNGDDTLYGGNGNDTIRGGAGADLLNAGAGGDTVEGNAGNDSYFYTIGDDVYYDNGSGSDDDTIYLPSGISSSDLTFSRLGDHDLLIEIDGLGSIQLVNQLNQSSYFSSIETIEFYDTSTLDLLAISTPETHGTEVGEYIYGILYGTGDDDDVIYGYGGDDTIHGNGGNNWIDGGAGNDVIWLTYSTSGETNTILASPGFDVIKPAASTDILLIPEAYSSSDVTLFQEAGSPYDLQIHISGLGQVSVQNQFSSNSLEQIAFEDQSSTITLANVQITQHGTTGNDSISAFETGANPNTRIFGYAGNDTLVGSGTTNGNDTFYGGEGDDSLWGSGGDDELHGDDGADYIYGGSGNDTAYGGDGNDNIRGELGDDIIFGGDGNDYLYGGITSFSGAYTGADQLYGGNGNDYLHGGEGNNILDGGAGDDTMLAGSGNDIYFYSSGLDSITDSYSYGSDLLHISGVTINDISFSNVGTYDTKITITASVDELTITNQRHSTMGIRIEDVEFDDGFRADLANYSSWQNGTASPDTLSGSGSDDVIIGFAGDDDIDAGAGIDHVHGGAGSDTINGDDGADLLHGGDGDDTVDGDAGDDILYGGDGLDTLWGDTGSDTFVFMEASAFNDIDVIKDFDVSTDSDVLDIIDILSINGYEHGVDAITDWIEITTNGSDSDVKVDTTGTGTFGAGTQIATLEGITGLTDEAALVSSGNLLVA